MIMNIELTRTSRQEGFTTGVLYSGKDFLCHTLEPQWRDLRKERKVKGRTAVREGTYRVVLSPSRKFGRMMPYLMDVPDFSGVMIHYGNTVDDTAGCILLGERDRYGTLKNSRLSFERVYALLKEAERRGEVNVITIK